ncbi:carboxy terminal-processing peptidase [Chitinophaga sp.]|uniref:carboxy terminal-processing peptidase n=1 Tax=Chitinophaga sp. TaxID=1869181 RepID=UPI002F934BE0
MSIAKYGLFLLLPAVGLTSFAATRTEGDVDANRKNVIRQVMTRIKNQHYAPKPVDDNFSRIIWKNYLKALDGNKNTLLKTDVESLRRYETLIDDELETPSLEYFNAIYTLSMQRLNEVRTIYQEILSKPMDFSKKETIQPDRSQAEYPADEAARREVWRKSLKYNVLKKMVELQTADKTKTDVVAEKEARAATLLMMDGLFKNLLSSNAGDNRFSAYMNTITLEMDPHTSYFAPVDAGIRDAQMAHRYYGLGLELNAKDGAIVVKRVLSGGTADASGLLQAEDCILRLSDADGKMVEVTGMSILDVSKMIRGEKGTSLKLLVRKTSGAEKEMTLTRGEIVETENAAKSAVIEKNGQKIGYLFLKEFYRDFKRADGAQCAVDMAKEIIKLKAEKVDGIVVDLRGNPGGSLDEVVKITGFFVKTGPVVLGRGKEKTRSYSIENGDQTLYDGPLAVMVDESSASASEIFAAAIQDYKRGIIVGSPSSYGKGTMQESFPMGKLGDAAKGIPDVSYGTLALTIKKFYRINGTTTQLYGVTPDVIFPSRKVYQKIRERDNTSALVSDTIESAWFMKSPVAGVLPGIIEKANQQIGHDSTLNAVKREVEWLKVNEAPVFSLQKNIFKKQLSDIQAHSNAIDAALKLPAGQQLKMSGTPIDKSSPDKIARNQEWLNTCSADVYLSKTVDILTDLAGKQAK